MKAKNNRLISFNKNNILESADRLFREQGIDKTTMDQIANKAELTKPTLYVYFRDKNEIYYSLVYGFMKKVLNLINSKLEYEDFDKAFFEIGQELLTLSQMYPLYFDGMVGNINVDIDIESTPLIYKEIYLIGNSINASLLTLINKGKETGKIDKNINETMLIFYLWSSTSGIIKMYNSKDEYIKLLSIDKKELLYFSLGRLLESCK